MFNKTVYILGAGASRTTNLPVQSGLLPLVFSIRLNGSKPLDIKDDFLSLNLDTKEEKLREFYPIFDSNRQRLGQFLVNNFSSTEIANQYRLAIEFAKNDLRKIDTEKREEVLFRAYNNVKNINVTLEDLFTIFDNVSVGREHFRLYSPEEMSIMHNQLKLCIIYAMVYTLSTQCNDTQYKRFSRLLIKTRLAAKQKEDVLSVITMNWDDVLEHTLYEQCKEYNSTIKRGQRKILPDLCFYDYSLDNPNHIPSTHVKAKGYMNIKILKMHGSLGWLECPKCRRMYTDLVRDIAAEEYAGVQCPRCKSLDSIADDPILRSLIITPTFMKSLNNLNLKNIWQNAYIDISEADHLFFIGYSFPDSDFEMRCLLKKAVKKDAMITVVLHSTDNPCEYIRNFQEKGFSQEEAKDIISKMRLPEDRYKSFFGEGNTDFCYEGLQGFLDEIGGNIDGKKANE